MRKPFGILPDGRLVEILKLKSEKLVCSILTYGGTLQSLWVPDRNGTPVDVLLGFDTLGDYCAQDKFIGALIGRYANRIGGASFVLHDKTYPLSANDGMNHLHGGYVGYDKRIWTVEEQNENRRNQDRGLPEGIPRTSF